MNFTPKTWLTGDTITAVELNRIEQGIEDAEIAIDALEVKSPVITLAGDLTGSVTLTNLGNGTLTATVVDDSHAHIIGNVDGLQAALDGKVPTTRTITAGDGLSGAGSLSVDRTIDVDSTVVRTTRTITAGTGLSGGGTLAANRTINHAAHTGDVTGSTALTIANGAVTPAKTSWWVNHPGNNFYFGKYDYGVLGGPQWIDQPAGFTAAYVSTGLVDITHNLGTNNIWMIATAQYGTGCTISWTYQSVNTIRVAMTNVADVRVDGAFSFILSTTP